MCTPPRPTLFTAGRRAFTLVEATVSLVIVSVILLAALSTAGMTARMSRAIESTGQGPEFARQLMGEITGSAFVDPEAPSGALGPEAGESGVPGSRSAWDDVDDYDGLVENVLEYKNDTPVPDATGWSRAVTVRYADPVTLAGMGLTESSLKRITVTVTAPGGEVTVLTGLRSRYGSGEAPPTVDTTYVTWVGVEIDLGDESTASSGVNLINHVVGGP